jgi:DNA-binding CsgD family transcriptional regulator
MHFHMVYTELEKKARWGGAAIPVDIHLTMREKEILLWAAEGKSDQIIADILGISYSGIRFHMNNVFKKFNVNDRTLVIAKAIRHGLILPSYVGIPDKVVSL